MSVIACSNAPFEPPHSCFNAAVQQSKKDRQQGLFGLGWHGGDHLAFLASAETLPHPSNFLVDDLPPDLVDAVKRIVQEREGIIAWRAKMVQLCTDVAASLAPLNEVIMDEIRRDRPHVYHVVRSYNIAFIACVTDALRFPDVFFVRRLVKGFPMYGALPAAGCYDSGGTPPQRPAAEVFNPAENLRWNTYLRVSVLSRGRNACRNTASDDFKALEAVWSSTVKELEGGWCVGVRRCAPCNAPPEESWAGFTWSELLAHPWVEPAHLRAVRRFGVFQKGRWRPIDDYTENGGNSCTGGSDKLSLVRSDSLASMHRAYTKAQMEWQRDLVEEGRWPQRSGSAIFGVPDAIEGSANDVKKAFRRLPVIKVNVVCFYNPITRRVEYIILPGFIFGAFSAVMAWNRYSAWVTHSARRLFACACSMYFDDEMQVDPSYARGSGDRAVRALVDLSGIDFEEDKHLPNDQKVVGLGVSNDFSLAPVTGCITLGVTLERRETVCDLIDSVISAGWITTAEASRLYGKVRFTLCPMFGRLGIAALQPLNSVSCKTRVLGLTPLHSSLRLIQRIASALQPMRISLFPRNDPPVIILTDAAQDGEVGTTSFSARVGVVLKDMRDGRMYYTSKQAPLWLRLLLIAIAFKKTYICQFELVGVLCAYLTFPDVLHGRLVHHFIDNEAALSNCISGYSGKPDSALILHELHVALAATQCHPWFGFVYSEDNISDLPSRNAFALLIRMGAIRRDCILPRFKSWVPNTK